MKRAISTILAIAGAMALVLLSGGGIRMCGLASQSGNSVAEYYYQAMGTCMIGFSFAAAGMLWGLSWMVAVWPDNQEIFAALRRSDSAHPSTFVSPRAGSSIADTTTVGQTQEPSVAEIHPPSLNLEAVDSSQPPFYDSLTSVDPTAPGVVRQLLFWLRERKSAIVWESGSRGDSVTAYVQRKDEKAQVCTVQPNGSIQIHVESLNTCNQASTMRLRDLRRLCETLAGTVFAEDAPWEVLTVPISAARSGEGFSNLVGVLQELMRCLKYS